MLKESIKNDEKPKKEPFPYDKIQKKYGWKFVNWVFKYYGIDDEVVEEKNPNVSDLGVNGLYPDFVGLSKYGHYSHVEFQTNKPTSEDLTRFRDYGFRIELKYNAGVITYVLTRDPCDKKHYCVSFGPYNRYHMWMMNHDDVETSILLNSLEDKILSNIKLTEDELLFLKVGFITDLNKDDFDLLFKVTNLVNKIKTESIEDLDDMNVAHAIFARHLLSDVDYEKIMRNVQMRKNIFLERFEAGKVEGKEEGKEEVARNLLKEGVDIEVIASSTGFSVDQINKFY